MPITVSAQKRKESVMMNRYFKSLIDQEQGPVVICNLAHTILYMNPAAVSRYEDRGGIGLVGKNLMDCHNPRSAAAIEKVLQWFAKSKQNNRVHTFYNARDNRDVYMIALRAEDGTLIGYYEQHIVRNPDPTPLYEMP